MPTTFSFHWLLRLPPTLRSHIVQPLIDGSSRGKPYKQINIQIRQFGNTRTYQAKRPPPRPSPPTVSNRPPPPPPSQRSAPAPSPPGPSSTRVSPILRKLLETKPEILLYRAPNHTSFFIHAYALGLVFIGAALLEAQIVDEDRNPPWFVRVLTSGVAIILAIFGTAYILAPTKLIKSVHLVAAAHSPRGTPSLRFQLRPSLPLVQRFRSPALYTIDAPIGEVQIDDKVFGDDVPYYNVPITDAEKFTQSQPPKSSIMNSLRNYPKTLFQDTRRIFVRDGFAYLQIPDTKGHWKLDLHNSYLLDHGQPLIAAMLSVQLDRSILTRLRNTFFTSR